MFEGFYLSLEVGNFGDLGVLRRLSHCTVGLWFGYSLNEFFQLGLVEFVIVLKFGICSVGWNWLFLFLSHRVVWMGFEFGLRLCELALSLAYAMSRIKGRVPPFLI